MSTQTSEINQISWRSIASLLVWAFLCSIVALLGLFTGFWALAAGAFANSMFGSGDYSSVWLLSALAIFLLGVSLFPFKIRMENGQMRLLAVLPGVAILCINFYNTLSLANLGIINSYWGSIISVGGAWVALLVYLLVSKQITAWQDWVGSLGALLVGIGLSMTGLYQARDGSVFFLSSPVWLSMAFFPELLRFRAGWKGALVGFVLWVTFGILSFLVFDKIFSSMLG